MEKRESHLYRANLRGTPFEIETQNGTIYHDSRGMYMVNRPDQKKKGLPKIFVIGDTHPAAYELALISVWKHGAESTTHYDRAGDPPSREANVIVDIANPLKEPRIHKFIPGGYESLESYRQEVVDGIRDSWIQPGDTYWTYTYHERLENWNPSTNLNAPDRGLLLPRGVNQIEKLVNDLCRDITSKGAIATTWMPTADPGLESNRPCLQNLWARAYEEEDGGIGLNWNWLFRSRDVKAWFMNGWALINYVEEIGNRLSERLGKPVRLRRISDESYSLHFYGKDQKEFEARFKNFVSDKGFERRIVETTDETFSDVIEEERKKLAENPHYNKNIDSQIKLAERIARDPNASERDKKFVRDFFPELFN
jgi:thymidylate synthase